MSFSWRTYLDVAIDLKNQNSEACYRSAISRAYYAVYNVLRIRAGYTNRQAESNHRNLISLLKTPPDELYFRFPFEDKDDLVFIANESDYLRNNRNKADYNGLDSIGENDCTNSIEKVELIFEMLDEAEED